MVLLDPHTSRSCTVSCTSRTDGPVGSAHLQELYSFLHFPYLFKKRTALEQAIKLNSMNLTKLQETMTACSQHCDNHAYQHFLEGLEKQVRGGGVTQQARKIIIIITNN
jgi:hypothetical protein